MRKAIRACNDCIKTTDGLSGTLGALAIADDAKFTEGNEELLDMGAREPEDEFHDPEDADDAREPGLRTPTPKTNGFRQSSSGQSN